MLPSIKVANTYRYFQDRLKAECQNLLEDFHMGCSKLNCLDGTGWGLAKPTSQQTQMMLWIFIILNKSTQRDYQAWLSDATGCSSLQRDLISSVTGRLAFQELQAKKRFVTWRCIERAEVLLSLDGGSQHSEINQLWEQQGYTLHACRFLSWGFQMETTNLLRGFKHIFLQPP